MMVTSILPSIAKAEELNWRTWLKRGNQYLKAATPKGRKSKFGTDVRYNLLAMAFENYAMAIADRFGILPVNHTFTDLIDAIEPLVKLPPDLKKSILKFEDLQSICSIAAYHRSMPDRIDLDRFKSDVEQIRAISHKACH